MKPLLAFACALASAMLPGCAEYKTLSSLQNAEQLQRAGKVTDSETEIRMRLAELDKTNEPKDSLSYLSSLVALSNVLQEKRKSDEACELINSVVQTFATNADQPKKYDTPLSPFQASTGGDHTALYALLLSAECAVAGGDKEEAGKLLRRAEAARIRDGHTRPEVVIRTRMQFAHAERGLHNLEAARRHAEVADATADFQLQNALFGPHTDATVIAAHGDRLTTLTELAVIALEGGNINKANAIAAQASGILASFRKKYQDQLQAVEFQLDFLQSRIHHAQHRDDLALALSDKYIRWLEGILLVVNDTSQGYISTAEMRDAALFRLRLLAASGPAAASEAALVQANRLIKLSETERAVGNLSSRLSAENSAAAGLLRELQQHEERRRDAQTAADRLRAQQAGPEAIARQQAVIGAETAVINDIRGKLSKQAAGLANAYNRPAISPQAIKDALRPGQAILSYVLSDTFGSYVTAVTPNTIVIRQLATSSSEIASLVKAVRQSLVPDRNGDLKVFDFAAAAKLHALLIHPMEPVLPGVEHIVVVPDAALNGLPFGLLRQSAAQRLEDTQWAIDRYAFSVLPSVESAVLLRHTAPVQAQLPFIGIGDPAFSGRVRASDLSSRSILMRESGAGIGERKRLASATVLNSLEPLPETADELDGIRRSLAAPTGSLLLRQAATETAVKRVALGQYRVIAFATHGVMADELSGATQPGLVLTPPATATELDDGYLSSDEIVGLDLNAELVILSACNTAAASGTIRGEGFSGLTRAFLYAGARSVLASHWSVVSESTVLLTTEMIQQWSGGGRSKPAALQAAMRQLKARPDYRHPIYWAPFDLVGR